MIARPLRLISGMSVATLIIALATVGGYRLPGSGSLGRSHLSLATSYWDTYASATGTDANSTTGCQRPYPCRTVNQAITLTNPGGQVSAIDDGNFLNVSISQAMTLDGGPGRALLTVPGGDGVDITAGPNDVVILRHLQLHAAGSSGATGIQFISGKALILDDVTIEGYYQGISVSAPGPASVTITNSRIQNSGGTGIAVVPGGGTVQVNINHGVLAGNYFGIIGQDGANISLTDSTVSGSTSVGVGCQTFGGGPCTIQTESDRFDHNWAAIWMNHAAGNGQITESLSNDATFSNTYGIYGDFGGTLSAPSAGNNRFLSNFINGTVTGSVTQM